MDPPIKNTENNAHMKTLNKPRRKNNAWHVDTIRSKQTMKMALTPTLTMTMTLTMINL